MKFVYFGTDNIISIPVLEELVAAGYTPELIVTAPDRPQGRKMILTPPPMKIWADEHNIPTLQPEKFDQETLDQLRKIETDILIVTSYGKIIPQSVLDIPASGVLNVHPSLLPKYRGSSPIESAILADDKETGVTIMQMDNKMDHGPIVVQEKVSFEEWPEKKEVYATLSKVGGQALAACIPDVISGTATLTEQDHARASFTQKFVKQDGQLDLTDDPRRNFLKYRAFDPWPGTFFFDDNKKRVKIIKASFEDGDFLIKRVVPEGKKEVDYIPSI